MEKKIKLIEVYSDIAGHRKGASLGISELRKSSEDLESQYFQKFLSQVVEDENHAYENASEFEHAKYIDRISLVIERLANRVKDVRLADDFPIILAGDHSSCAGTMHGLKMAHPDDEIGVVYIDAHADFHSPYTSDSGNIHGMPLAVACALDNKESMIQDISDKEKEYWDKMKFLAGPNPSIKPENVVFCAVRDYEQAEKDLMDRYNIHNHTVEDITLNGISSTVKQIFEKLSHCKHIYVSFDVDSVDPLFIPGTGTPVTKGLSYDQALQLNIELIKNEKVCCWEMAEINPMYNNQVDDSLKVFEILEKVTDKLVKHY